MINFIYSAQVIESPIWNHFQSVNVQSSKGWKLKEEDFNSAHRVSKIDFSELGCNRQLSMYSST